MPSGQTSFERWTDPRTQLRTTGISVMPGPSGCEVDLAQPAGGRGQAAEAPASASHQSCALEHAKTGPVSTLELFQAVPAWLGSNRRP